MPSKKPTTPTNKPAAAKSASKPADKQANQAAKQQSKAAAKSSKPAKKTTKQVSKSTKKVEAPQPVKKTDPLFPARPKNFRIGNDVLPRGRDLTRFVRWPRYIRLQRQKKVLLQRLKVPPSVNQFKNTLNKNKATELFNLLIKYRPETKQEKTARLRKLAEQQQESKDPVNIPKPKPVVKFGLHHITQLVESKQARLVVIAHDVQPIDLILWLPALCRKMDIPYCIVKNKSRLGTVVHQKNATALAFTEVEAADQHKLNELAADFKVQFNSNSDSYRKWGGGIVSTKTRVKLEKREKATEAEAAKHSAMKK
jgi:large subunit ribosomal protein L7Ae